MTEEFTRFDRFIFYFKIVFSLFFFAIFLIGTPLALFLDFSDNVWMGYWTFYVILAIVLGIIATIWFLIGGFRDLFDMVRTLKNQVRDDSDDGWVRKEEHLQKDD